MLIRLAAVLGLLLSFTSGARAQEPGPDLLAVLDLPAKEVQVFGLRTVYYEAGQSTAPVLILIPGINWEARHAWAQNVAALARTYRVIAIDLPGLGRSDKPLIDFQMETWTDALAEFLRVRGIPRATFAGPSMGGAIAIQMALAHPELVQALVVSATESGPGAPPQTFTGPAFVATLAGTRTSLLRTFFDPSLVTDELVRMRYEYLLGSNIGYTFQRHLADHRPPFTAPELERIRIPALFVWCRQDQRTPLPEGEAYARALPDAELSVIDKCGHLPNMERPSEFNAVVADFLRRHISAAAQRP